MNEYRKIWVLDKEGNQVLRDLHKEHENFSWQGFYDGKYDSFNALWQECFNSYVWEDNGCDYERFGTILQPDDVVLDIGGNIGLFAYRAEYRGVKKVYSFEPMTPTFNCLVKNISEITRPYNLGVDAQSGTKKFFLPEDYTHCGGGTSSPDDNIINNRGIAFEDTVQVIGINDIFKEHDDITYMKIDVEGGEVDILPAMSDENLLKLRCLVGEYHSGFRKDEEDKIDPKFYKRMEGLGFKHFTLHHNGGLRTFQFWQENYKK